MVSELLTIHSRVDPICPGPEARRDWMPMRTRKASTSFLQTSGAWNHIWCPASGKEIASWFGRRRANSSEMECALEMRQLRWAHFAGLTCFVPPHF